MNEPTARRDAAVQSYISQDEREAIYVSAELGQMTDRDAAVDAVMAAIPPNVLTERQLSIVRAAVEQYGREQWDNGRYDALRMVFSEDTIRRAADMTYHNVERELAELERQRGTPARSAMTQRFILTKGLPGSGKSTWAKAFIAKNHGDEGRSWRRFNRDDLRRMMGKYDDFELARETIVTEMMEAGVVSSLKMGQSVIVDDCNLNPQYIRRWQAIADEYDAKMDIQDFTHISLRECLKRNAQRVGDERVSNKVIHEMYNRWLAPNKREYAAGLPTAVICDLDGTLAIIGKRSPYDASKCDLLDKLNVPVAKVVHKMADAGHVIIFMSGREEKDRMATQRFLDKHGFGWAPHLYMRKTGDKRPDVVVKRELFDAHVNGKYNIEFCIDDRDGVVDLWRSLGLTCFQVGEGWF